MVSFVILHYKNIKDTIECLESLNKFDKNDISIIIVDNNTLTENDEKLLNDYPVDLIKLDQNVGFAKANNIGCKYAIEKWNPDFLVVSNNDIVIEDNHFLKKLYEIFDKEKFDLLGPFIETNGGQSVNPFPVYKTKNEVKNQIKKTKKLISIYKNILLRNLLKIYVKTKMLFNGKKLVYNSSKKEYRVALHGCFIIFSKKYYEKYNDIFYNDTFLYHEEEFLYQRIIHDNLISLYDPSIKVFHKEGASLNNKFKKNQYKKLIFKNEQILKSLLLLEKQIDEYESR